MFNVFDTESTANIKFNACPHHSVMWKAEKYTIVMQCDSCNNSRTTTRTVICSHSLNKSKEPNLCSVVYIHYLISSWQWLCKAGVAILILHTWKQTLGEDEWPAQGHRDTECKQGAVEAHKKGT